MFNLSYMNNTKWYELFYLLNTNGMSGKTCRLKYLLSNHIHHDRLPQIDEFDKYGVLDGAFTGGPVKYNEIEYLEILGLIESPKYNRNELLAPIIIKQDIEAVSLICNHIGKLEIDYIPGKKIRIYGYK